jgi:hypothetical protein
MGREKGRPTYLVTNVGRPINVPMQPPQGTLSHGPNTRIHPSDQPLGGKSVIQILGALPEDGRARRGLGQHAGEVRPVVNHGLPWLDGFF